LAIVRDAEFPPTPIHQQDVDEPRARGYIRGLVVGMKNSQALYAVGHGGSSPQVDLGRLALESRRP
jgi:hypothetical protein